MWGMIDGAQSSLWPFTPAASKARSAWNAKCTFADGSPSLREEVERFARSDVRRSTTNVVMSAIKPGLMAPIDEW
jgi:hypothetical protein